ncbi:MAG: hypothetical protein DHS20C18_46920 [Saprospiraceae bacterium]|nr:MAG: hypothetical protein DHS20C18_46920 [Saprospiraceae bacterium]
MNQKIILQIISLGLILTFLVTLCNLLFGISTNIELSSWSLLANTLVAIVLTLLIQSSQLAGWRLALLVFTVYFIIGHFSILIEAYIFKVTDGWQTTVEILRGLVVSLIISPIAVSLLGRWTGHTAVDTMPYKSRSWFSWSWRIVLGILLYFVIYAMAGMTLQAVYPEFMAFYEGKIPAFDLIFKVQLFRGLMFVLITLFMLSNLQISLGKKAILVGLIFSVFGGIAPLLSPNDLMPAYVRLAHGFEVGISNFLYGVVLGYLLNRH